MQYSNINQIMLEELKFDGSREEDKINNDESLNSFKWTDPSEKVQHSALEK